MLSCNSTASEIPRTIGTLWPFLAAGLPVCIGGFHISGCIAMLPEMPQDIREAQALGIYPQDRGSRVRVHAWVRGLAEDEKASEQQQLQQKQGPQRGDPDGLQAAH